ncbi:ATP-binding protein [Frankia canadensis]|nr:ATP-binding protein [Frankia canadensis]
MRSSASRTSPLVLGAAGARALVVGTGGHAAPPALGRALVDRCGLAEEGLRLVTDPSSPLELGEAVADVAEDAAEALAVCFQGLLATAGDGALYLGTAASDTRPHRLAHTWLPLTSLLAAVAASPAPRRLVVVDVVRVVLSDQPVPISRSVPGDDAVPDDRGVPDGEAPPRPAAAPGAAGEGTEILAAAGPDVEVVVLVSAPPPGTGQSPAPLLEEWAHLLVNGDPDGPVELTVERLIRAATRRVAMRGHTVLRSAATWSDQVIMAYNVAHTPPIADLAAAPTALLADGPGPVVTPVPRPAADPAGAPAASGSAEVPRASAEPGPTAVSGALARRASAADEQCPYPGLASFDGGTRQWFFGRERAVADALSRLEDRLGGAGPLVLVGASGSGKSSLLRAGLLPALARGAVAGARGWPQVVMTPTDHPARELAGRLAAAAGLSVLAAARLDVVSEPERFVGALADLLALRPAAGGAGATRRVVIVVDQFEETFTLCADERERTAFIRALVAAARGDGADSPPAVVVLGVRADFYGWCAAHPELVDALQRGQVVVGPMTAAEVRDAIVRPAETVGLAVEPGLVDLMVHDLGASEDGVVADPGSLPLLAHALRATWQERENGTLTVAGYLRVGGLRGAIARTAEETFGAFDAAGQDLAWQIMLRLVRFGDGTDDTRRRVPRAELLALSEPREPREPREPGTAGTAGTTAGATTLPAAPSTVVAGVLDALVGARLVTADADSVEISHEALLRSWPRLREWIEVDRAAAVARQRLADAATSWDNGGRDPSYLFTGSRLAAARESVDNEPGGAGRPRRPAPPPPPPRPPARRPATSRRAAPDGCASSSPP